MTWVVCTATIRCAAWHHAAAAVATTAAAAATADTAALIFTAEPCPGDQDLPIAMPMT